MLPGKLLGKLLNFRVLGFGDMLNPSMCQALDETTCAWCEGDVSNDDALILAWLDRFEAFADPREGAPWWAFAIWGYQRWFQTPLQGSPSWPMKVKTVFLGVSGTSPMWTLLLDGHAIPGAVSLTGIVDVVAVAPTPRLSMVTRGPIPDTYGHWTDMPSAFTLDHLPQLSKDMPVPVLRMEDGAMTLLCIHLFSGRRRDKDIHWWLDTLAEPLMPSVKVLTVSMDTAVHAQAGNLMTAAGLKAVLELVFGKAVGLCIRRDSNDGYSFAADARN